MLVVLAIKVEQLNTMSTKSASNYAVSKSPCSLPINVRIQQPYTILLDVGTANLKSRRCLKFLGDSDMPQDTPMHCLQALLTAISALSVTKFQGAKFQIYEYFNRLFNFSTLDPFAIHDGWSIAR
jgi:hypothetical protein